MCLINKNILNYLFIFRFPMVLRFICVFWEFSYIITCLRRYIFTKLSHIVWLMVIVHNYSMPSCHTLLYAIKGWSEEMKSNSLCNQYFSLTTQVRYNSGILIGDLNMNQYEWKFKRYKMFICMICYENNKSIVKIRFFLSNTSHDFICTKSPINFLCDAI